MAVNLEIVRKLVESRSQTGISSKAREGQILCPCDLPMDWRYEFEERAAILEYDGGLSRNEADSQALREIAERIDQMEKI